MGAKPLLALQLVAGLVVPGQGAEEIPPSELEWRNGDVLAGRILPSSGERISWKADEFLSPFRLDTAQLARIRFPENYLGKSASSPAQFRITFTNGDRLFGNLVEINPRTVTFECPRLSGEIEIERRYLQRIERVSGSRLRYSGPTELDEWKTLGRSAQESDWQVETTGEFSTNRWGGELFREIGFPRKVEIAFSVACPNERPNFEIGVSEAPDSGPRIETWDDTLVLTDGNRFAPILNLSDTTRELNLRIFWDQVEEEIRVCDADGITLARLERVDFQARTTAGGGKSKNSSNARDPGRSGFRLLNRTTEMAFSRLTVREWDGETIPRFDATKPRLELSGGDIIFNLGTLQLKEGVDLRIEGKSMPVDAVDQLVFSTRRWTPDANPHFRVAWYDGSMVSGNCVEIDHASFRFQPSWLNEELEADLKRAKDLFFPEADVPVVTGSDVIKAGKISLGGVLTPGWKGSFNTLLAWRPPGAENASPLGDNQKAEVTREAYPGATELVGEARIYLTNDEVIAGKLVGIDEENVAFVSDLTGRVLIPHDKVRAVDIEGAGLVANGFVDKGWQVLDGPGENNQPARPLDREGAGEEPGIVMEKDKVIMRDGGFGHMNLLVGDRIRFRTKWQQSYGAITLRLFCSDFERSSPSTDLIIAAQGNRILVGQLKRGGGFSFSGDQVTIKDQQADIEVLARHDQVEISVNGKRSLTMEVQPELISGNGLVIQMGGGWRGWNSTTNEVEFTEFSVDRTPGYLPKRIIDPAAKSNALTIPRFHRKDPPTHVLVAPNGDLLRGKLVAARGDRIRFVSREKEVDLPRSRVSAIIWLREKEENREGKFDDFLGYRLRLSSVGSVADLPEEGSSLVVAARTAEGVHVRIFDDEGRKVVDRKESELATGPYLEDLRSLLKRDSSEWTGIDEEEYLEKIVSILQFHVTHQFVLHDGTRLNLDQKDIEKETFIGRSSVLGICRVPLQSMRNMKQAPAHRLGRTSSSDQLAYSDWVMAHTPEPAIPKGDGSESSPLIGKDAPNFTIPLLTGGEFSLSDHRGRVVVLDFWATWCGPCIRAMPEVFRAISIFRDHPVVFCAVNQAETPPIINQFLETRGWNGTTVGLDFELTASRQFNVKGIPQTVVIGKDGKIAWVHTGFDTDLSKKLANAIGAALQKK